MNLTESIEARELKDGYLYSTLYNGVKPFLGSSELDQGFLGCTQAVEVSHDRFITVGCQDGKVIKV